LTRYNNKLRVNKNEQSDDSNEETYIECQMNETTYDDENAPQEDEAAPIISPLSRPMQRFTSSRRMSQHFGLELTRYNNKLRVNENEQSDDSDEETYIECQMNETTYDDENAPQEDEAAPIISPLSRPMQQFPCSQTEAFNCESMPTVPDTMDNDNETPVVSGQWLAIAQTQIKPPLPSNTTDHVEVVDEEVAPLIAPPTQQVRRSRRLALARTRNEAIVPPMLRRSPRLALLPRVSYVGMC
jgi:hypothetical protein